MRFLVGSLTVGINSILKNACSCGGLAASAVSQTHTAIDAEKGDIPGLCERLLGIIKEIFIPFFINSEIDRAYPFLTPAHKLRVFDRTLKKIKGADIFETQLSYMSDRLKISLYEKTILNLDGFFTFRIRDIREKWQNVLDGQVSEFLKENEREELLNTLKAYALGRTPLFNRITVVEAANGRYAFFDENGTRIITMFSEEKDYTREEELINSLLYMSPVVIDLTAVDDEEMKIILRDIFTGRVIG